MDRIRIGVIGAGFVASLHARVFAGLEGFGAEIVGIASQSRPRMEELARKHKIAKIFTDIESLVTSDEIDVVDLCIPNDVHKEFVLQAAQAGKHIICEKPLTGYFGIGEPQVGKTARAKMLAEALASADAMVQTADKYGVKLMYAENWLYSPVVQRAKRLIKASGGTILELRGEESHHGSHTAYAKNWHSSGGGSLIRLERIPLARSFTSNLAKESGVTDGPSRPVRLWPMSRTWPRSIRSSGSLTIGLSAIGRMWRTGRRPF